MESAIRVTPCDCPAKTSGCCFKTKQGCLISNVRIESVGRMLRYGKCARFEILCFERCNSGRKQSGMIPLCRTCPSFPRKSPISGLE